MGDPSDSKFTYKIATFLVKERRAQKDQAATSSRRAQRIFYEKFRDILAVSQCTTGIEVLDDVTEAIMEDKPNPVDALSGTILIPPLPTRQCAGGVPPQHPVFSLSPSTKRPDPSSLSPSASTSNRPSKKPKTSNLPPAGVVTTDTQTSTGKNIVLKTASHEEA